MPVEVPGGSSLTRRFVRACAGWHGHCCSQRATRGRSGASVRVGKTVLRLDSIHQTSDHTIDQTRLPASDQDHYGNALGKSMAMRRIFALLPRIASSESTVLIEGETGTGKTILAQAIHEASPRMHKPFVVVDCSAIPPGLIESV